MIELLVGAEDLSDGDLLQRVLLREENITQTLSKDDQVRHWSLLKFNQYRHAYWHVKQLLFNETKIEQAINGY